MIKVGQGGVTMNLLVSRRPHHCSYRTPTMALHTPPTPTPALINSLMQATTSTAYSTGSCMHKGVHMMLFVNCNCVHSDCQYTFFFRFVSCILYSFGSFYFKILYKKEENPLIAAEITISMIRHKPDHFEYIERCNIVRIITSVYVHR